MIFYQLRKEFNLINEIKVLRINFIGIRKIFKRDALIKLEKLKSDKWEPLFEISLEILGFWTKFLCVHINQKQKWNCAGKALEENENDYPRFNSKKGENEENNLIKLPDYVELMLNYRKFVKNKLKSSDFLKILLEFCNFLEKI